MDFSDFLNKITLFHVAKIYGNTNKIFQRQLKQLLILDATKKCVRQYFNRNKGKWVFSPAGCDKKPEEFPRVVQLPQDADPENDREATECKVLDRKTMYNPE